MPSVGPFLSIDQLKALWVQAGGDPAKAGIAAAVAFAESSGGTNSWNTAGNSAGTDEGLWQINTYYNPRYATYDALSNARGAVAISNNGTNWQPWSTYNSGAYQKYLSASGGTTGAASGGGAASTGTAGAASSGPQTDQASFFSNLWGWLNGTKEQSWAGQGLGGMLSQGIEQGFVHAFASILKFMFDHVMKPFFWIWEITAGAVLVLAGIAVLTAQTQVGRTAASLISVVPGPVGAVGKGAAALGGVTRGNTTPMKKAVASSRASVEGTPARARAAGHTPGKTQVIRPSGERMTL